MKNNSSYFKYLIIIFILASNLFAHTNAVAQTESELVIQLHQFNFDKQINDFKNIVSGFKALKLTGYCRQLSCVYLKVDRNLQPDDAKFFESLKSENYVFELKTNTTIAQVQSACRDAEPNGNDVH